MESTTPSGVWALRIGGLSLLLHRRNWLMCGLLTLLLAVLATLAISLGSGKMGLQDVIATLLGNGSKLQETASTSTSTATVTHVAYCTMLGGESVS